MKRQALRLTRGLPLHTLLLEIILSDYAQSDGKGSEAALDRGWAEDREGFGDDRSSDEGKIVDE